MSVYDEEFIDGLDNDPMISLFEILRHYFLFLPQEGGVDENVEYHLETFAFVETIILENKMDLELPSFLDSDNSDNKINIIYSSFVSLHKKASLYAQTNRDSKIINKYRTKFSIHYAKSFAYEFSQGDLDRIQVLLNEMRDLVSQSEIFEANH